MEQASPAVITVVKSGNSAYGSARSTDGGKTTEAILCSRSQDTNSEPDNSISFLAIYKVAPVNSTGKISPTDESKLNEENCKT
ncbi:hypothetical protein D3C71_1666670 [compost metagenome]